jgi:predicted component of type VI protein secretion system
MTRDGDFVRLNLEPLATTIQANARAWVKELGKMLNESARENLMALKGELEVSVRRNLSRVLNCTQY